MFEIIRHNDVVDKVARRRIVDVTFSDGSSTFAKQFTFSVNDDIAIIKKKVLEYRDELNFVPEAVSDFILEETEPEVVEPTADERARTEWQEDWQSLKAVTTLKAHGVEILTSAQLTTLTNKVRTGFKKEYQDLV
jgi:hypothetical protein